VSETHTMAVRAPNRTVHSSSASTLAQINFLRGRHAEAQRWADEAFEIAEAIGNVAAFPAIASVALAARVAQRIAVTPARYLDAIEQGLAVSGSLQLNIRFVGEAMHGVDAPDRAARLVEQLRRGPVGGRLRQTFIETATADLLVELGRPDEAAPLYAAALARAEEIGARSALVTATLGAASVAAARGEPPMVAALERAIDVARGLKLDRYRPRLEQLLAATAEAASA